MQSLWQYFRTFTVPSFATSGARVVLDGVSGTISVYNSSNQKTAQIGGSSGQILAQSSTVFAELLNGALLIGKMVSGVPDTADAAQVVYVPGSVDFTLIKSHLNNAGGLTDAAEILLFPGAAGISPPQIGFRDAAGNAPVEAGVFGALTYMDNTNALAQWQYPGVNAPLNANWATNTTFNGLTGYAPLQYRLTGMDQGEIYGGFKAGATAPTNPVLTLPAAYRPANGAMPVSVMKNTAGTVTMGHAYISASGNIDLFASAGGVGITANAEYLIWGTWPLNINLQ